jgi:hypothetical protein
MDATFLSRIEEAFHTDAPDRFGEALIAKLL